VSVWRDARILRLSYTGLPSAYCVAPGDSARLETEEIWKVNRVKYRPWCPSLCQTYRTSSFAVKLPPFFVQILKGEGGSDADASQPDDGQLLSFLPASYRTKSDVLFFGDKPSLRRYVLASWTSRRGDFGRVAVGLGVAWLAPHVLYRRRKPPAACPKEP
jgi:hypothetical protein